MSNKEFVPMGTCDNCHGGTFPLKKYKKQMLCPFCLDQKEMAANSGELNKKREDWLDDLRNMTQG